MPPFTKAKASSQTDSLVALPEVRLEQKEVAPCTTIREVTLLKDLRNANIVRLHEIIRREKSSPLSLSSWTRT